MHSGRDARRPNVRTLHSVLAVTRARVCCRCTRAGRDTKFSVTWARRERQDAPRGKLLPISVYSPSAALYLMSDANGLRQQPPTPTPHPAPPPDSATPLLPPSAVDSVTSASSAGVPESEKGPREVRVHQPSVCLLLFARDGRRVWECQVVDVFNACSVCRLRHGGPQPSFSCTRCT